MSVTEPKITESGNFITLAATPDDKLLLFKLAKRNGDMSQSAMVRKLIRDEAIRQGITLDMDSLTAANPIQS